MEIEERKNLSKLNVNHEIFGVTKKKVD